MKEIMSLIYLFSIILCLIVLIFIMIKHNFVKEKLYLLLNPHISNNINQEILIKDESVEEIINNLIYLGYNVKLDLDYNNVKLIKYNYFDNNINIDGRIIGENPDNITQKDVKGIVVGSIELSKDNINVKGYVYRDTKNQKNKIVLIYRDNYDYLFKNKTIIEKRFREKRSYIDIDIDVDIGTQCLCNTTNDVKLLFAYIYKIKVLNEYIEHEIIIDDKSKLNEFKKIDSNFQITYNSINQFYLIVLNKNLKNKEVIFCSSLLIRAIEYKKIIYNDRDDETIIVNKYLYSDLDELFGQQKVSTGRENIIKDADYIYKLYEKIVDIIMAILLSSTIIFVILNS